MSRQKVGSQLSAMNAATAQMVTLTSAGTDDTDYTAVGSAVQTMWVVVVVLVVVVLAAAAGVVVVYWLHNRGLNCTDSVNCSSSSSSNCSLEALLARTIKLTDLLILVVWWLNG